MNYIAQSRNRTSLITSGKFWVLTLILILIYSAFIFAQNTVYIDPTNTGDPGQNGSVDHPYDSWSDVSFVNGNTYLQKCGTIHVSSSSVTVDNKQNISIGSYGSGGKPVLEKSSGNSPTLKISRSKHIEVDGFEIIGLSNRSSTTVDVGGWWSEGSAVLQEDIVIRNCDIHRAYNGIRSVPFYPDPNSVVGLEVYNCNVYDIQEDGFFIVNVDNVIIEGCHVWDFNLAWFTNNPAPGDGIQLTGVDMGSGITGTCRNWLIKNNIVDKRGMAGKFCIIVGNDHHETGFDGALIGNTIYMGKDTLPRYPGDSPGGSGAYISGNWIGGDLSQEITIAYNKFIGRGQPDPGDGGQPALVAIYLAKADVYYNIFDSCAPGSYIQDNTISNFYNNTVVGNVSGGTSVVDVASKSITNVYNNLGAANTTGNPVRALSGGGSVVYQGNNINHQGNGSDYNSYLGIVNWQASDFHLTENSLARNTGFNYSSFFFDMDSIPVPQENTRDVGSFEYSDGGQTTNNPPVISNQTFSINENAANGSIVGVVIATDPDGGQTLTYSIISGNTNNAFAINPNTGALSVNNSAALNFEATPSFGLTVKVQDNGQGNLYSQATITVNLTNVNETPNIGNQTFSVAENSANGQQVGIVVATDPDGGQTLTYSIISGNTNNAFVINPNTGALSVNNSVALNFEVTPSFGLTVKVQDNGQGNLYSQATVTINLTNVNETPSIGDQAFSVAENSPNGQQVGIVVATDPDGGQTLTYSIISGNTNNAFAINPGTGALSVNNSVALNFEATPSFGLTVKVQDNGQGNLYSQATITVNLTNVNENPNISNQTFTVPESSPNGYQVGIVVASDPDNGQTLTFAILNGNTDNAFALNSITGALTVANSSAINSTVNPTFNLVVEVTDNGSGNLSSQGTVTVNVTDINQPPQIINQTFTIAENSANGQQVGIIVATDPDAGQTLTYSIISGNTNNAFAINPGTGALSVNNSAALNFEVTPSFGLTVKVQDNGQGNLYSQATITVNLTNVNETPNIGNQTFSVAENSANGQQVGIVVATDPDGGQTLTYSIMSGNTNNAFAINPGTGALSVNNSTALNFEVTPSFGLTVRAQDNGQGNLYSQATITVNLTNVNENPNISNQTFTVPESSPNGQQVGIVVATDPDAGQTLTYSIISGNTNNAFAINPNTGALSVNNSTALNFEATPSFGLTVKVQDNGQGNLYSQATVTINLTNVNETPSIGNQTFTIAENSANGQQVGIIVATDPDAGQTLTYSIISGNTNNTFAINSNTGALSVNNSAALNFEATPSFGLTVKVQDNGQGNLYSQATITVNLTNVNETPNIGNQTFSVAENSANGQQVGIVVATDPDGGQTLTYSIMSGNTNNAFQINATTGALSVNNSAALNFEVTPSFGLTVKVQDNGQGNLYSQATVTVNLTNVNETPSISNQTFTIAENSANGQQVGIVVATDPDGGQTLTYSITNGNTNNAFQINASTGALSVNNSAALNFEATPSFGLTVKVQDNGQGNLYSQALVTITLINVNEAPVIDPQNMSINVNAGMCFNDHNRVILVGQVNAFDPDAGQTIHYSIEGGNFKQIFGINPTTGKLYLEKANKLNLVEYYDYPLLIRVVENNSEPLFDEAVVTVTVHIFNLSSYIDSDLTKGDWNAVDDVEQLPLTCDLYPNPANNFINIKVENLNEEIVTVSFMDLNGQVIITEKCQGVDGRLLKEFNVEQLSKGLYIVSFVSGEKIIFEKFIKL